MKNIPVYEPMLGSAEKVYVKECLDSNWISSRGRFIGQFEGMLRQVTGSVDSVAVCNGTVALHLALLSLGIGPGDEVIVPTFTYIASVNAIAYVGAIPVFVDSLMDSWQIDPSAVERAITSRTRAIMAVHLYGQPSDMLQLMAIAERNNIFVVEDCAEAIGSKIGEKSVGTFGHIGTLSFFGNKTITTGEGGALIGVHAEYLTTARKLRGQGLAGDREYWHDVVGYNYRMTNICAAIGVGQLEKFDYILSKKRRIAEQYRNQINSKYSKLHWEIKGTTNSFWMCTISVNDSRSRDGLREFLKSRGIETRPGFYPAHMMPMYSKFSRELYPVACELAAKAVNLPSSPLLSEDDVAYVADTINKFFG